MPLILDGDWRGLNTGLEWLCRSGSWRQSPLPKGAPVGIVSRNLRLRGRPSLNEVNSTVAAHFGAVNNGPPASTCMWIHRWVTMNARGYDGPGLAVANLPFII